MPNVTLSLPEELLKEGRKYAQKHHTSLNALIRELLQKVFQKPRTGFLGDFFALADRHPVSSKGKKWKREDLYEV